MSAPLSITDIARNLADYVNRVAYRGEAFVVMRGKKPVAELRPVVHGRTLGDLPQILASLPRLTPDEEKSFEKDLATSRKMLKRNRNPWA